MMDNVESGQEIYTVSRLNRETRRLLAEYYSTICVEGEISNLASPSSGHLYFSLKDSNAQIRCAMFRSNRRVLQFKPENGVQVHITAQVSLYEARGEYQLVVSRMEEAGFGILQKAFERLKSKLAEEGLFAAERKKPVPVLPRKIGVITSPTGAAIRDILSVLNRRFPAIPIALFPVPVQGADAVEKIADAIELASKDHIECDVLLIARGGGSLEDLWAFNEELVARVMANCPIAIVSGIGHETDFTIADFVADLRAPTPSAAAEAVTPDQLDWFTRLDRIEVQLFQRMRSNILQRKQSIQWIDRRLMQVHPGRSLQDQAQRLDELELRLQRSIKITASQLWARLEATSARLGQHNPGHRLNTIQSDLSQFRRRLHAGMQHVLGQHEKMFGELTRALQTVSPLATLSRGYAIVSKKSDGHILRSFRQTQSGDEILARLAQGHLICEVKETRESSGNPRTDDDGY